MNTEMTPKEIYERGQSNLRRAQYVIKGGCFDCQLCEGVPGIFDGNINAPVKVRYWCTKHEAPVESTAFCKNFTSKPSNS